MCNHYICKYIHKFNRKIDRARICVLSEIPMGKEVKPCIMLCKERASKNYNISGGHIDSDDLGCYVKCAIREFREECKKAIPEIVVENVPYIIAGQNIIFIIEVNINEFKIDEINQSIKDNRSSIYCENEILDVAFVPIDSFIKRDNMIRCNNMNGDEIRPSGNTRLAINKIKNFVKNSGERRIDFI